MDRRRMLHAFKAAKETGNYEDAAVLPEHLDPQVHLSRNSVPQPFYLVCEHDTIVGQLSGAAHIRLRASSVNAFTMGPGDMVYVPAGTPHRIEPMTPSVQIRYKVRGSEREAAVWTCAHCGGQVARLDWRLTDPPSAAYAPACQWFNEQFAGTRCPGCGQPVAAVDLQELAWPAQ